jgi:hypothetical protein
VTRGAREAYGRLGAAVTQGNPAKAFLDCGINLDRWYPLSRRMLGTARFELTHRRDRAQQRRALDTVRERFNVRCGPLIGSPHVLAQIP